MDSKQSQLARRYEESQTKTFTAWINYHLSHVDLKVNKLETDLCDGCILCQLCEVLTGEEIKFNPHPRIRIHRIENANVALNFMKLHKIKIFNISAEDIVDGNLKLLLALIWGMARTFQIGLGRKLNVVWEWESSEG